MITPEKIKMILEKTLQERILTTKNLKTFGISSYDINVLLESQRLERLRRGEYRWIDTVELYQYGKQLIKEKQYDKSDACFKACYELNSEDSSICFQMFCQAIMKQDYETAITYYQRIMNGLKFSEDKHDLNTCLLMLRNLVTFPEAMEEQTISYDDIISLEGRNQSIFEQKLEDKLRHNIYTQQYDIAFLIIKKLEEKYPTLNPLKTIMKVILHHVFAVRNLKPLELAKAKDYEALISHLEILVARNPKDREIVCALELARERFEMEKTDTLPICTFVETRDIYEALEHRSYKQAKSLSEVYKSQRLRLPNATILQLLDDIISFIEEKRKREATVPNILLYLRKEELNIAFELLRTYLKQIGKPEYESVMIELIKVGYQEPDAQFRKAFGLLNNENINVSSYALFCYEALATKNYDLADSYISVLTKLRDLGYSYPNLEQMIEMKKQLMVQAIESNKPQEKRAVSQAIVPTKPQERRTVSQTLDTRATMSKQVVIKDTDQAMLEEKAKELEQGTKVFLLKPMTHTRRKKIYRLIKAGFPNMRGYGIGTDPDRKRLLLKAHSSEKINCKQELEMARQAYQEKDFSQSIYHYQKALVHLENPEPYLYSQLGLAYMQRFAFKKAITYLTIANEMNKEAGKKRDFTDLIEKLKGNTKEEDEKPFVMFFQEDFQSDLDDYFGLVAVEEMAILITAGKPFEEVTSTFHLNEEQICLLKLIFARNCYAREEYELGDSYAKSAEQMKHKSQLARQLLDEIRINKRFYKNRITEEVKPFVLTK